MTGAIPCDDGALYTAPVGRYRPNRFGLYDLHGNVWEGTEDCYHPSYAGAPSDEAAWTTGGCVLQSVRGGSWDSLRVVRGGSWESEPGYLRASNRTLGTLGDRNFDLGFRLAQDI